MQILIKLWFKFFDARSKCKRRLWDFRNKTCLRENVGNNKIKKIEIQKLQAEQEQQRIDDEIKRCIPKKYWHIDTDKQDQLKQSLDRHLFVNGDTGTGKTVFVCSLGKEYIRRKIKIKFISYIALIMRMQCSFKKENRTSWDIANDISRFSGVLILDDVGAEKMTEFVRQMTYYIINEREQRDLRTLITSNFSLGELNNQIDPRISSRIAGMCKVLKFKGEDRRIGGI